MLTARESAPGSRFAGPFCGRAVDQDGEPGSAGAGQVGAGSSRQPGPAPREAGQGGSRSAAPRSHAVVPLLDRAGRRIQRLDHAQPATQLADRSQARVRRQGSVRRAGPHLLTPPAAGTYPAHQIGILSAGLVITWQRSSSQARAAPIGTYRVVSPTYSRNRV
jgi:hypothetical protein